MAGVVKLIWSDLVEKSRTRIMEEWMDRINKSARKDGLAVKMCEPTSRYKTINGNELIAISMLFAIWALCVILWAFLAQPTARTHACHTSDLDTPPTQQSADPAR